MVMADIMFKNLSTLNKNIYFTVFHISIIFDEYVFSDPFQKLFNFYTI